MKTGSIRSSNTIRLLALLLAALLLPSEFYTAHAEDGYVEDGLFCYEITDGEATLIECDSAASGEIVIPAWVDGYPVTSIGEEAFSSCSKLTGVTIPDSVTSIGEQAFYGCTGLTAFTVDAGNTSFTTDESGALYNKDKTTLLQYPIGHARTAFTVPNGVTVIGAYAFAHARKLQSVTLADSVTQVNDYAFYFCAGLTAMTLPDGVTELGFGTFEGCSKIMSVSVGKGLSAIGDNAFRLCKDLTQITVDAGNAAFIAENNVLYNKDKTKLMQYPIGTPQTSFTIPDGVTEIGPYAFGYAESLQRVTVPEGLTEFGESALYYCTQLAAINLPGSVTVIGGDAFRECRALNNVILPEGLTSIGYYAYYGCVSLDKIILPDSVTHVGYQAFYGCTSLAFAHVPAAISYMDWSVFDNCPHLAYLCADTADCYAKAYAAENGVPFHVCGGRHPILVPHHPASLTEVHAEYEPGAFGESVFLLAEPLSFEEVAYDSPAYETGLACNPRETLQSAYQIRLVNEAGQDVPLNEGQKATLFIPIQENGNDQKSRVCHILGDAGKQMESYKLKPKAGSSDKAFAVSEDGHYFILEVESFGTFILVEETIDPTVAIRNFVEYRKEGYKTTMHFGAETTLPPDGSTVHWFLDNADSGTGETFTVRRAKASYTVQAKLIDEDGTTVLAESEVEHVTIQTGFWAKLLAFLRMLVFMLPNITQ